MDKTSVKVREQNRAAALGLCELWIPLLKEQEFSEIIAKHVELL